MLIAYLLFPSGHVFFLQRALRGAHAPPYAVHLTFQARAALRRPSDCMPYVAHLIAC
jgi:hypothetical protein